MADGYWKTRVPKYDRDGRLQDTWGAYGEAAAIGRPGADPARLLGQPMLLN